MDYVKQYPVAMKAIAEWIAGGLLKRKFHIVHGLDAAPSALPLLYSGGNTGKLCVIPFPWRIFFSHLASSGSFKFPSTKSYPSFELLYFLTQRKISADIRRTPSFFRDIRMQVDMLYTHEIFRNAFFVAMRLFVVK